MLVTYKWPKFLPLIDFLFFNKASANSQLTNLIITLLVWPLLFLERGNRWQPWISLASTSIPDSFQMLITVFSKLLSQILFDMPDKSTLFLRLPWTLFAWLFSKFMILSSNPLFTFFVTAGSLVTFLFSNEISSIASASLCIWSDSLCKSVSTIIFPFRSNIFRTNSDFFSEFKTGSERYKILVTTFTHFDYICWCVHVRKRWI